MNDPVPVGIPEIARIAGLSRQLVHYYVGRIDLKPQRVGKKLFFWDHQVDQVLAAIRAQPDMPDGYVSLEEAARTAGISYSTARARCASGEWAFVQVGRRKMVKMATEEGENG